MQSITDIKGKITNYIESISSELKDTALEIWDLKEPSGKEYRSAELLQNLAAKYSFNIIPGAAGLDTAFEASFNKGKGIYKIAFLAEYDALPEIGHGCGHNLIGAGSLGAAAGLAQIAEDLGIEVYLFGTPAEETAGGKINMLNAGCFDNIDFMMMFHPSCLNAVNGNSLAIDSFSIEFTGNSAHAAADPFAGANALDGMITLYNNVALLRQQLRSDARIHFIIKKGGDAVNIIPDRAMGEIAIRAKDRAYLSEVTKKITQIAQASASATFTNHKMTKNMLTYFEMIQNPVLGAFFKDTAAEFGITDFIYRVNAGSVDMGNISHEIPCLHAYLNILENDNIPGHSKAFANAARKEKGLNVMVSAAKIMAVSSMKIVKDEKALRDLGILV